MKFNREELLTALDVAKLGIDARDFIPILSHFCFHGDTVVAYNDFIGVQVKCKTNFTLALQANTLLRLLNSVSSKEIEIGFAKNAVFFKSGAARTGVRGRLPFMGEEDFLFQWPSIKRLDKWELNEKKAGRFFYGLKMCLSSVGDQMPSQMGITLNESTKSLAMYSTNNKALSRHSMAGPGLKISNIILPTIFCQALLKAYGVYGGENVVVRFGKDHMVVDFGEECSMYGKLINNKDPLDFEKVIKEHLSPAYEDDTFKVPKDFAEAFDRALLILTGDLEKNVQVTCELNTMSVEAKSTLGKVKSSAVFKRNLPAKDMSVDAELAAKAAADCTRVYFGKRAIVFRRPNYIHLLSATESPMRRPTSNPEDDIPF